MEEQHRCNTTYAQNNESNIIGQFGDFGKRHHAYKRRSFQAMLEAIPVSKPDYILVQRLDRFGTQDNNELGYFLTILKQNKVKLITTIDGMDRSKTDLATMLQNVVAAAQSTQEQIDKAERVLTGKRGKAVLGQYLGGKYLTYGFDLVCIGRDAQEKWRMVEDAYDLRIKYTFDESGNYTEAERYGNEVAKDPNGIMPDKLLRYRPRAEKGEQLFYSPSIRQQRVDTLRRICEMFAEGWTTYRIATQLNAEGNKPVHSSRWYSAVIDGLLENTVLIGKPTWNRTTQSSFRQWKGNRIVATEEDRKGEWRPQERESWVQPDEAISEPIIPPELFERVQALLEARRSRKVRRAPRNGQLWFGGLWVCGATGTKMAGDANQKCFRVKHPDHQEKKLTFNQAERFIGEYLEIVGERMKVLGDALESRRLLEALATNEWLTELKFDRIRMEIENYLAAKMGEGRHKVADAAVIISWDDGEGCHAVETDGDYLELYCEMVRDDLANNRQSVQEWMEERDRLTMELLGMKGKTPFIIEAYNRRIGELSSQIEEAVSPPDYKRWWAEVQDEVATIQQQQEQVKQSIAKGEPLRKAQALRQLIDHIEVDWATEPTTDRRCKGGVRTYCKGVRVFGMDGNQTEIPTNETASASSWFQFDKARS
jgi:DNA invertase Pin-like site-specific DNA recombinase